MFDFFVNLSESVLHEDQISNIFVFIQDEHHSFLSSVGAYRKKTKDLAVTHWRPMILIFKDLEVYLKYRRLRIVTSVVPSSKTIQRFSPLVHIVNESFLTENTSTTRIVSTVTSQELPQYYSFTILQ